MCVYICVYVCVCNVCNVCIDSKEDVVSKHQKEVMMIFVVGEKSDGKRPMFCCVHTHKVRNN
jgi:hypothetical protein